MSERMYALLLRLYPRAFRQRYAQEMMRTFRDRLRHEPTFRLWIDVLKDAVVSIPHRHWVQDKHPMLPTSAAPLRAVYATQRQACFVCGLVGCTIGLTGPLFFMPAPWRIAALIVVAMLTAFTLLVPMRRARRASRFVKSCRAEAGPDSVTVAFAGFAPLTLQRSDIVGLHVFETKGLRIQAADPARDLWVPARTAAFEAVKAHVSGWAPTHVTPFFDHPENLGRVVFVTLLAVSNPQLNLAGFVVGPALVAGATLIVIVSTLRTRDLSVRRKLLAFAPALILFVRWLW